MAVLFLSLAFMAVFVLELLSGQRVHAVQYLFVGLAMTFFYVLLLSLAEQIGFGLAYLMAATASGGMLSIYVGKALASRPQGLIMLAVFLLLYGLLYLILNLEDYALLAGAIAGLRGAHGNHVRHPARRLVGARQRSRAGPGGVT